jgi:hypothetical protein
MRAVLACAVTLVALVARATPAEPPAAASDAAEAQVRALLDDGHVEEAATAAAAWLQRAPDEPRAHAFMAITRLCAAARHIASDVAKKGARERYADEKYLHELLKVLDNELARADADLAAAATDPRFVLVLCPGCWHIDWQGDGSYDDRALSVEYDAAGKLMAPSDPRRHPTFAFDVGDVHYLRGLVAFARAVVNIGLGYHFADLMAHVNRFQLDVLALRLDDKTRLEKARAHILAGLDHIDHARLAYLAERDDDREWIPNPRQQHHPVPLAVDEQVYQRWAEAIRAVRALVRGESGLDVALLVRFADKPPKVIPRGFLDVGALFSRPRDFELRVAEVNRLKRNKPDELLKQLFGDAYVPRMRANPLPWLILRAVDEARRAHDKSNRKMRYILWLN